MGWYARGGTLLKWQWEVQGGGNPEGIATHISGGMALRELLVPQGRDTLEGMMAHVRAGWKSALLRDQSSRKAIKPHTAEDTSPPSHLLCQILPP